MDLRWTVPGLQLHPFGQPRRRHKKDAKAGLAGVGQGDVQNQLARICASETTSEQVRKSFPAVRQGGLWQHACLCNIIGVEFPSQSIMNVPDFLVKCLAQQKNVFMGAQP